MPELQKSQITLVLGCEPIGLWRSDGNFAWLQGFRHKKFYPWIDNKFLCYLPAFESDKNHMFL